MSKYDTETPLYGKKWYSNDKDMGYKADQKILPNSYELKVQYRFYTDVVLVEKLDEANLGSPSKLDKYEEKRIFRYSQHMLRNYLDNNLKLALKKKSKISYDTFMYGQNLQDDKFYASPQIYENINYIKKIIR